MFHSRNPLYRCPTGAVAANTEIHFKITMPRELHCSAAKLVVEDDAGSRVESKMFWCGMNGENFEWWECHFTPETSGLFFYYFEVNTWRGQQKISRRFGDEAVFGESERWQLTVYNGEYTVPSWLQGGIMYQIFPDRFCNSGEPKQKVPSDRFMHQNWNDCPVWRPNEHGEITNKDYFGGDLKGIEQKLPYLKSLGVTCLYLNPIFEAHSNHRYDTADYSAIDPLLGTEEDFSKLCSEAQKYGIHIILDGVFNHTGSDSLYFNRYGRYPSLGAYNSKESPYFSWYTFRRWPDEYDCWWDFNTLPDVNETNPDYNEYINGKQGIIRKWLKAGAAGWRLDVVDELPDEFIDSLNCAAKSEKQDAVVLGEVWEDASNKCAYGVRRRYLIGGQLDSVMNYPFRNAILGFLTGENPAEMMEIILTVLENYPMKTVHILMNHIGTHDTMRAITALAGEAIGSHEREWQSKTHLSNEQREKGLKLMRLASLLQFTLPGIPCIYYGDEVGMEGYRDPFNRKCYPWGKENTKLLAWYRSLARIRKENPVFIDGEFIPLIADCGCLVYVRKGRGQQILVGVNREDYEVSVAVPDEWRKSVPILGESPTRDLNLPAYGCVLLLLHGEQTEFNQ